MKKYLIFIFLLLMPFTVLAETKTINVHLFYQNGCSHCDAEKEFFEKYLEENKDVKLYTYNIYGTSKEKRIFKDAQVAVSKKASGVPYLAIGSQVIIGYGTDKTTGEDIKNIIDFYRENNYRDLVGEVAFKKDEPSSEDKHSSSSNKEENEYVQEEINVPILGKINPKKVSLPLLAVIIGFVDGFNPCAMWILIFLISMLFGMKNQKRMWVLGLTFIGVSAFVYFLFMVGWLELAEYLNSVKYFRIGIAVIALIFGIVNIKRYIKQKQEDDGCDVVDDKKRSIIMKKIKQIVTSNSFIISLVGIALLAVSVNIIELLCSLGLPVMYTNVLAMNNIIGSVKYLYIFIYILFFMIDDLIIFFIAMKTLKIKGISTKYTKYSHLIGGLIMLLIAILMIFKPEWLMFNFK